MVIPRSHRRLELCEGHIDQAIADRGPDYDWAAGSSLRAMSSDGQPRREPLKRPLLAAV